MRLGDLEILNGKGWQPFITLSAGKDGEKFGFLIKPGVRSEKGKELLHPLKDPHIFRLVRLGSKEYLYVDKVLVGQGSGAKITEEIPVKIVEEIDADATKVKIDKVKLYSVTP